MTFYLHKANGTFGDGGFWSFGIQTSGSILESAAETAWSNAVAAFFGDTNVKTYYSPDTTLTATSTSTASATFHQTTITRTTHAVVGTSTSPQLPTTMAVVTSFYTPNAIKAGRGRIFLPAPTTDVVTSPGTGQINAAVGANLGTAIATLFTSLSTAGLTQILYTRRATRGGTPAYTTSQVTSRVVQGKLHVQKRRSDKILVASFPA